MRGLQWARLLQLLALAARVWTYNADLQARTIITSGLSASDAMDEAFGFSITHHRYSNGDQALFVGAPKAYQDATVLLRTGKVYKCEVAHNTSQCQPEPVFNSRESLIPISLFNPSLDKNNVSINGQLLGFTVRSFGEQGIIACAPLYLENAEISGRCLTVEQDYNSTSLPIQYTTPRYDEDPLVLGIDTVLDNSSIPVIFIGAIDSGAAKTGGAFGSPIPSTFGEHGTGYTPTEETVQGYHGYHLETADFTKIGNILMSGPVGNEHRGRVVPLLYDTSLSGSSDTVEEISSVPNAILEGPEDQTDSYFGYDFAVLQLDKNGYDSVVVGCPLCDQDRGQLFIYLHTGDEPSGDWENFASKTTVGNPSNQRTWFGSQVENIGDIDRDGFEDLAVSAPYDGNGKVYIYRGTQNGLSETYQTILPQTELQGFGYVLTGNFDVDGNKYTDFAVGGLPGDPTSSIEIIRSNPIVIIEPTFDEGSDNMEVAITYPCITSERLLLCFNVTPCFNFYALEGDVQRFAFKYTVEADPDLGRVSLLDNFRRNFINREYVADTNYLCGDPVGFVLSADFFNTIPIPIRLVVDDSDNPLKLESPEDNRFGGSLTPILGRYLAGNIERNVSTNLIVSLNRSCGDDNICEPDFSMDVDHNITMVYLADLFRLVFDVTLNNIGEDSFATVVEISVTPGLVLANFESINQYDLIGCEMLFENGSYVRCRFRNPISTNETVAARIILKPNIQEINLGLSRLELNFSVGDGAQHIHAAESISFNSTSIAGYKLNAGFGNNIVQTSFLPPADFTTVPVRDLGTLVTYTITLTHSLTSFIGSTVPRMVATITWPTASGNQDPLLIIVDVTSVSATCEEQGIYPYNVSEVQVFEKINKSVPVTNCPSGITCGILQCTFFNLTAAENTSANPPLNLLIQAVLYGQSVAGNQEIPVMVTIESGTEYPIIVEDMNQQSSTAFLTITPAVTEFRQGCSLIPYIITIVVSGVFGLVIVIILGGGMCGKTGRYYIEHRGEKKIQELKKTEQEDVDTGLTTSLGTRTIPPPGDIDLGKELNKEKEKEKMDKEEEAELEDQKYSKELEAYLDTGADHGETEL